MIHSARLHLRPFADTAEDAAAFYELSRDAGFMLFPITHYRQESVESARAWVRAAGAQVAARGLGKLAVFERETGGLIGMGGLTPWTHPDLPGEMIDITYRLRASAWGRGFGLELARALVDHAFGPARLSEVTATITPDNEGSRRIAEKIGMKLDRRIELLGVPTDLWRLSRRG